MSTRRTTSKKSKTKAKTTPKKGSTAKKTSASSERSTLQNTRRQLWSLIMFGAALILGVLTFLPGENIWLFLHKGYFGLFGITTYLVAPLVLVISILLAFEKTALNVTAKIVQALSIVFLTSGAFHIFFGVDPVGSNFFYKIINLFELGVQRKGGGLAGALIGWSLSSLFGNIAAGIVIVIVIIIFLFITFGVTMKDILGFAKSSVQKPVKQIEKAYQGHLEQRENAQFEENEEYEDDDYQPEIDIALGPDGEKRQKATRGDKAKIAKQKLLGQDGELAPELRDDECLPEDNEKSENDVSSEPEEISGVQENLEGFFDDDGDDDDDKGEEEIKEAISQYKDGIEEKVYTYPPLTLLNAPKIQSKGNSDAEIQQNAEILMDTLSSFGVKTRLLGATRGPAVTRYELQPSAGVRISKITQLSNDIALNLAATKVRIEAPIPNKAAVGIEVPNSVVSSVTLREVLSSPNFKNSENNLEVALGKDISGNIITTDLAKMPHLLIAGTTGSGKSVCTNSMIISLLYKSSPAEVKLMLIDPKMVEFNIYNGIPHLLAPVVTDPKKAAGTLNWAVSEMERRYTLFAENKVKDISSYNSKAEASDDMQPMPKVVIIIDEFADLMMTAPGDVETAVCRLAQKARAAGMHLVIATQRPSVNVITGLIKANITSRIALTVSSQIDSRTIIDSSGAEALLGRGDMLFKPYGSDRMLRVQGCFVSEKEINDIVSYIKNNESAEYDQQVIDEIEKQMPKEKGQPQSRDDDGGLDGGETDPLFNKAVEHVIENGKASTSLLQRKLKIGYSRAASLIDEMEERNIIGGYEGSKPRQVLITLDQWKEMCMRESE